MIGRARNILSNGAVYGLLLTAMVLSMQHAGVLENLEHWCYDQRVRYFQFFNPPPTDRLVHLDIDDAVMDSLGQFPWPRQKLAEMIDEIAAAKPRSIAMDVLFSDAEAVRWLPQGTGRFREIDDDAEFAAAIRRAGCVVIGTSFPFDSRPSNPVFQAVREALTENLERDKSDVAAILRKKGIGGGSVEDQVAREFIPARREAAYLRVRRELERHPWTARQLHGILLRQTDENRRTPIENVLDEQYAHVAADLAVARFSRPVPAGLPPLLRADQEIAPIPALTEAAASAAFFDYPPESGGTVRRVPLFIEHNGRIYPHISIVMAAMQLGASFDELRFGADSITIPRHIGEGGDVVVPVYTIQSETLRRAVPMMFDIPFFGSSHWESMYDKVGAAHLTLNVVWDICQTRRRIIDNNLKADDALKLYYAVSQPEEQATKTIGAFEAHPLPPADVESRQGLLQKAVEDFEPFFQDAASKRLADISDPRERLETEKLASTGKAIHFVLTQMPLLKAELEAERTRLRQRLADRAVLIGWTATASVTDRPPTPLHSNCPGVVIHGVIYNAMMTGHFWRRAPNWVNGLVTICAGLIATLFASRLTPSRAFVYAILMAGGYWVFNGLFLFDRAGRIVSLAGPLVAIAVVWAGCTLVRLLVESMERARITRRFSSYVDPSLVSYVAEHPDQVRLEGQVRELTVVFTDLEGFTKLTEQLGEKAVAILNEFMGMAVPIIRSHKGLVNKFLGDGIMFFFGAPLELPDHAARAIASVLDLQSAMVRLNETFVARGLPRLALRAGISTGHMVVGDAGSADASDYTVLGDCVNLGARLESANKLIGSSCLVTHRTIELAGDAFLVRPIGTLCVVGRQAGTMTHEPLARVDHVTETQAQLADLTRDVVECYQAGKLDECLHAIERMEAAVGRNKFTALYREQCESGRIRLRPGEAYDCQIVLTEK